MKCLANLAASLINIFGVGLGFSDGTVSILRMALVTFCAFCATANLAIFIYENRSETNE